MGGDDAIKFHPLEHVQMAIMAPDNELIVDETHAGKGLNNPLGTNNGRLGLETPAFHREEFNDLHADDNQLVTFWRKATGERFALRALS